MMKYTTLSLHPTFPKPVDVAADNAVENEQEIIVDLQTHFVPQN